jgi:hypothetical protein
VSKLGVALRYFTNHQVALARSLEYGFLPLDNGIVERLHVRTALTRKTSSSPGPALAASGPPSPTRSSARAVSPASIRASTSRMSCRD